MEHSYKKHPCAHENNNVMFIHKSKYTSVIILGCLVKTTLCSLIDRLHDFDKVLIKSFTTHYSLFNKHYIPNIHINKCEELGH